jgi:hypothetical protein
MWVGNLRAWCHKVAVTVAVWNLPVIPLKKKLEKISYLSVISADKFVEKQDFCYHSTFFFYGGTYTFVSYGYLVPIERWCKFCCSYGVFFRIVSLVLWYIGMKLNFVVWKGFETADCSKSKYGQNVDNTIACAARFRKWGLWVWWCFNWIG